MRRAFFHEMTMRFLAVLCLAAGCLLLSAGTPETPEEMLRVVPAQCVTSGEHYRTALFVLQTLQYRHYKEQPMTAALQKQWLENYFSELDPQHLCFRKHDLMFFLPEAGDLWRPETQLVDVRLATRIFQRYLERLRERMLYCVQLCGTPMDFSQEEFLDTDRSKAEYFVSAAEQRDYWRRMVKNDLLNLRLARQREAERVAAGELKPEEISGKTEEEEIAQLQLRYARLYKYTAELQTPEVLEIFLNALAHLYDPHTAYMAPDTTEDFQIQMRLSLSGIGATLTVKDSYVTIVEVVPGSPADRQGRLQPNDRILAVAQDGKEPVDCVGLPLRRVVSQIRGPKGTKVHLTIQKEGTRTPVGITLVRDTIQLADAGAFSQEKPIVRKDGSAGKVLVIHLPSYYKDFDAAHSKDGNYKSASRDVQALLEEGIRKGIDGVILDLRGNGGGALDEAVQVSGLFFPSGPVVQVRDRESEVSALYDKDNLVAYGGPLVVLTDRFSASASEITAAALQDLRRAVVVGDAATHGKGTVQSIFDLDKFFQNRKRPLYGTFKLTLAKFYRINGETTQHKGVIPDIVLPSFTDAMELGEGQYDHALSWDIINGMPYQLMSSRDTAFDLPALRAASRKRWEKNPELRKLQEDIADSAELQKLKKLPLQWDARLALEKRQEQSDRNLRRFFSGNENIRSRRETKKVAGKEEEPLPKDLILQEAVEILQDMVQMRR